LNGKISEIHAALGVMTLPLVDKEIEKRRKIINLYKEQLSGIEFQYTPDDRVSTYKDVCILAPQRDRLSDFLTTRNIQTKKYFTPIHQMAGYKKYYQPLPVTELIAAQTICLPIFNDMMESEVLYITESVYEFYKK